MSEWLQTYNEMFGMYHAGIITTIFGAFAVTFTVLMSWPKLVLSFAQHRIMFPYHRNVLAG